MSPETFGPPYWSPGDFEQHEGFPRYPAAEMDRRFDWLAGVAADAELDAIVVGGATAALETSVQFFTNWPAQVQSYAVFPTDAEPFLLVRLWNHLPDARRTSVLADVRYGGDTPATQAAELSDALAARGVRRVGLIGVVPHADYDTLRRRLPDAVFEDLNARYQTFRLVKTEAEMVFTRIASRMNDAAVAALATELRPGMNEYELAKVMEDPYLAHRGVNLIHFSLTTPMADPRVCVPHQLHPDRRIQEGDVFVTEISTTFWGYSGQILRTFTVGADPTDLYARLHETALEAYEGIVAEFRGGATVGSVLDAADVIEQHGFDIWDDLVHGFGGAYLPPIVRTRSNRGATHADDWAYPLGTLLVVQPNVILGDAGVQIGNSMWLSEDGVEVTQKHPNEIIRCA